MHKSLKENIKYSCVQVHFLYRIYEKNFNFTTLKNLTKKYTGPLATNQPTNQPRESNIQPGQQDLYTESKQQQQELD